MILEPLLTRHIGGMPLRIFASPEFVGTGRPDLPWHSADDLRRVLCLDAGLAEAFRRRMKSDWDEVLTVGTSEGITTIAPHFMAEGMLDFMRYRKSILSPVDRRAIAAQLRRAVTEAIDFMVPGLRGMERALFAIAAQGESLRGGGVR